MKRLPAEQSEVTMMRELIYLGGGEELLEHQHHSAFPVVSRQQASRLVASAHLAQERLWKMAEWGAFRNLFVTHLRPEFSVSLRTYIGR